MRAWPLPLAGGFLLGTLVGAGATFSWRSDPCTASFREVAPRGIEVSMGTRQFGIRASLIGCADSLSGISNEEMQVIQELMRGLLRSENWMIWPKSMSEEYRDDLTRRVNATLGRRAVSDVHLYGFSAAE